MAKQIVTLGIGAMDTLIPFITTGLEIGVPPPSATGIVSVDFASKRPELVFASKRPNIVFTSKGDT